MVVHLVVGVALLAVGMAIVVVRKPIAARHHSGGRYHVGSTGFAVTGAILLFAGLGQLVLAFS